MGQTQLVGRLEDVAALVEQAIAQQGA